jgi:ABC-type glycerol-3-phosphate transport system permease component
MKMPRWVAPAATVCVAIVVALPMVWALIASLLPESALFRGGLPSIHELTLAHYRAIFTERDFWTPVKSSLIVASATTTLCVALGAMAAYALVRLRLRGTRVLLLGMLAATMFPQISIVSPLFLLLRRLGLLNTYAGLVLPYTAFALPLAIWLMVGVFRRIPPQVEEAAMVDGTTRWGAFTRVAIPLAAPGIATTAILTFLFAWNEFLFALSFTLGAERQTVPVAIALFRGQYQVPWGEVLAASIIATIPVVLVVLLFQRRIVAGLSEGAVVG